MKNVFAVSYLAQLLLPIDPKNSFVYGYVINKEHNIL